MRRISSKREHSSVAIIFLLVVAIGTSGCLYGAEYVVGGAISAARASNARKDLAANKKPEMTQLQKRKLQTREYESVEKTRVLEVAVQVLQDDGFVISNANTDLGLLSASKDLHKREVDDAGTAFVKGMFTMGYSNISSDEFSAFETNLTVTQFGEKKVRARMAARLSRSSTNGKMQYEQITDAKFYQEFFTQLEKGIFIEQEGL